MFVLRQSRAVENLYGLDPYCPWTDVAGSTCCCCSCPCFDLRADSLHAVSLKISGIAHYIGGAVREVEETRSASRPARAFHLPSEQGSCIPKEALQKQKLSTGKWPTTLVFKAVLDGLLSVVDLDTTATSSPPGKCILRRLFVKGCDWEQGNLYLKGFSQSTTCRLFVGRSLDFAIEVFPKTLSYVRAQMRVLHVPQLLIFLWRYNFDVRAVFARRFFHDCRLPCGKHPCTIFRQISERPAWRRFVWHDFANYSYHSLTSHGDLQESSSKSEEPTKIYFEDHRQLTWRFGKAPLQRGMLAVL